MIAPHIQISRGARSSRAVQPKPVKRGPPPNDYGAKPDRKTDNTDALQRWLNAIAAEGVTGSGDGNFLYTGKLTIHGETDIRGSGKRTFRLYNPTSNSSKLVNANGYDDPTVVPIDKNISLRDMCFEGHATDPIGPGVGNVNLFSIENLTLKRVLFLNSRMYGAILGYNWGVRIHDCEVDSWGDLRPYPTPGDGQYSAGIGFFGWRPNFHVSIKRCWLRRGHGIGMWWDGGGRWLTCTDNLVDGANEAGYVGWPVDYYVARNKARHVRRVDISGHGMESQGGPRGCFLDNEAEDCDGTGFFFTDMQDVRIEDNRAVLVNRGIPRWDPMSAAYIFRTATADPALAMRNVSFKRNHAIAGGTRVQHAVTIENTSGNAKSLVLDFESMDNDWGNPAQWQVSPIGLYPSPEGVLDKSLIGKVL